MVPSPISPRAMWDRGAKSPLAPTVPFSGTNERQLAAGDAARQESEWVCTCMHVYVHCSVYDVGGCYMCGVCVYQALHEGHSTHKHTVVL